MKSRVALTSRVLAVVMLLTSLFSAGYVPVRPALAESGDVNVFAGAGVTATANGEISDVLAPSKAIDGNFTGSKWSYEGDTLSPDAQNPYWLKIDAGAEATVHRFVVAHAGAAGEPDGFNTRDFMIETSSDDVHWTTAVTVTDNTYGTTNHALDTPVTARYFKLNITDPGDANENGNYQANIYEFEAYGAFGENPAAVPVTGITLDKHNLELAVGDTDRLTATVAPNDATNAAYTWASDDPAIAEVSADGLVTAKSPGTTGITATTADGGYKATALVAVTEAASVALADGQLIAKNSVWTYLDNGTDQGTAWRAVNFDDSEWKTAPASLGYAGSSKPQPTTVIEYGSSASNKYITTYFRKEFQVADTDAIKQLSAALIRDDGAVIYLNGQEVHRTNLPQGAITYNTLAPEAVGDERDEEHFDIDPALLVDGTNVIAAEVHQQRADSSDLYFSLELNSSDSTPPVLGKNQGLLGEYYTNNGDMPFNFVEHKATIVDSQINFTNLDPVLQTWVGRQDDANVRWTGQIMAPESGDYTFYMIGDNGFKLWIDDQVVIDHWVNDWDKEQTSQPVTLEGGVKYKFKVEYFEDFGGSNLYLRWSTPNMLKDIVPATAFYLPENYTGPISGNLEADGLTVSLNLMADLSDLPSALKDHLTVKAGGRGLKVESVEQGAEPSVLKLKLEATVKPKELVNVVYDGQAGLKFAGGGSVDSFTFSPVNQSEAVDYSPKDIAMSLYGDAKTTRSFAWYTSYEIPDNAPGNILDSIVEVVPADQDFDSAAVMRFVGDAKDTQILKNLNLGSTTGSFISHKAIATGLAPGTAYKYRVGSDGNWSQTGRFTTEGNTENEYDFLYMTDSQGANTEDYRVWANSLNNALDDYPDARFLVMPGDLVDAGANEGQWSDYFGQPQDLLMNLPLMATIGNHEGPNNNNFFYHFNLPDDSHTDPKPRGTVYSFDYGPAHIMVLNTGDIPWDAAQTNSFNKQIEWLRKEVAQTDKKWKIVAFHKAIYSVGNHATDTDIAELRKKLYPVLDELGIDLVLQGHDHTFMRSYQMYNNQPVTNVKKDENGRLLNPDGTLYMINNSPGRKYYQINPNADKYYAATYQQPNKPIYSGVHITEDSLTISTYISGEDTPFDKYTIVQNSEKPNPVEGLSAKMVDGKKTELSWTKPADKNADDAVRGFRIYEVNGRLGPNWSVYVSAVEGQTDYRYTVDNTDPALTYEFAVRVVDKRDNSDIRTAILQGNVPPAPTAPVVDDARNTFGWTVVPGYDEPSAYEYSVDGGKTWQPVTAKPQPVGDHDYPAGTVLVRVKGDGAAGTAAGLPLASDKPFTVNGVRDTYALSGVLKRENQLKVDVEVERLADYTGSAYVVFELLNGNEPLLINAIPLQDGKLNVSQYFNVSGDKYSVKVFVFDEFNSNLEVPLQLAKPVVFQ
ncbi:PA14 domain-containing protein [Paenibacillus macerans]|uniref:PA14 domain-containing protein n=1 Tax=Paenibacillus macerans TaxID=44252 RepID=UPI00203E5A3D|nr:PA14 domain-containing protein [Paenibacillus macerans]MCM3700252.1 PA14 domain-containing protein [Paenibacillus macerans]